VQPAAPSDAVLTRAARLRYGLMVGAAAVGSYLTARLLPLPEPYWAPIAAVVVLSREPAATRQAALQRLAGTLVGSAIGWAGAAFGHESVVAYGVAIFLGVIVCEGLRLERSGGICAVTTSVIMLIPRPLPAHLVALHRFLEVCCGLLGALVVSAVVDRLARVRASRPRP
jgi:uncharacterized membrane protein YgaE (UPF0421/DUF939 family)